MSSPRNGELPPWYGQCLLLRGGGVKLVLSYSKPHTFSTFLEKKK